MGSMPDPTDPPRPALRKDVADYLTTCTWNEVTNRLENAYGDPVAAWLNMTGTPAITCTVQWEASKETDLGIAVGAHVPHATWNIVKNGDYDDKSGLVEYEKKTYRFAFVMDGGQPTMVAYET
jgi:hypothetical protein